MNVQFRYEGKIIKESNIDDMPHEYDQVYIDDYKNGKVFQVQSVMYMVTVKDGNFATITLEEPDDEKP